MGLAALILGIIGIGSSCIPCCPTWIVGLPVSIVAIILGAIATLKEHRIEGVIGFILGILGLLISIGWIIWTFYLHDQNALRESTEGSDLFSPEKNTSSLTNKLSTRNVRNGNSKFDKREMSSSDADKIENEELAKDVLKLMLGVSGVSEDLREASENLEKASRILKSLE